MYQTVLVLYDKQYVAKIDYKTYILIIMQSLPLPRETS